MYNNPKIIGQKNPASGGVINEEMPDQAGLLINIYKLAIKKAAKIREMIKALKREFTLRSLTLLVMVLIRFRFLTRIIGMVR
jgi:hypothetical protein